MGRIVVRASVSGGNSLDIEVENGTSIGEVLEQLEGFGFNMESKVSLNGKTASLDTEPCDGDDITVHKTPEGA